MALEIYQLEGYNDTADIIRASRASNTDGHGKAGPETYTVIKRGVPYRHTSTANISDPTAVGRTLRANLLTKEEGEFEVSEDVPDGGIIRRTTPDASVNGKCYRILGPAKKMPPLGPILTNHQQVLLREFEHPPSVLPA